MSSADQRSHRDKIIGQFSRQAIPFTQVPGHLDALQLLISLSGVGREDTVLDVACGPGIVACAFARHAKQVTGLDITPAMIEQAEVRQRQEKLGNLAWVVDRADSLPYADDTFSLVITRYSFHHMLSAETMLNEMVRVCQKGGRVLVADVAVETEHSDAYDRLERTRDPSHTHALTRAEFADLFERSGLINCRQSAYGVDIELESQLRASFPNPGDERIVREMITDDVGINRLGIDARRQDGQVIYTVPIAVYMGWKL